MSTPCSISLFPEALPATWADIEAAPLDVFFALGIVNPWGPTLTLIAAVGQTKIGAELPLVWVMLNPFSQRVDQIGVFQVGDIWEPVADFDPLLKLDYGDCPTLVLLNASVPEQSRHALATAILASFGEGVIGNFQRVQKHFGDPWGRVSDVLEGQDTDTSSSTVDDAASGLAQLVLSPSHIRSELQALLYAWEGSIEKTGISDQRRRSALAVESFKSILFDRVMPSIWLPDLSEPQKVQEPETRSPQRLGIESIDDLHAVLESGEWREFDEQRLVDMLRFVLFVYGQAGDHRYIQHLGLMYRHALQRGMEVETRMLLEGEMVQLVESEKVHPFVFLLFLVEDADSQVTTKAAIDFVSSSGYAQDELYAFTELRNLFLRNTLADRAAVFGALVAMGDSEVMQFVHELKPHLSVEEVRRAARVHTLFPQHLAIQFWLAWAKELAPSKSNDDLGKFGSCASALILVLEHDRVNVVSEGKRNFPCRKSEQAITVLHRWTREEYAELLAPDLYALEQGEEPPRIFSDVLRAWGLKPRAPLNEQYIPEPREGEDSFKRLRDPKEPPTDHEEPKGYLSRLFGRR